MSARDAVDPISFPFDGPAGAGHACRSAVSATTDYGHARTILHEVRHALEQLIAAGEETRIDLAALPFGPGDLARLHALLGEGEVTARVEALGPTLVRETAIPGVWWVDYRNGEDERLSLHLEIARIPSILQTQDLQGAVAALDARLAGEADAGV